MARYPQLAMNPVYGFFHYLSRLAYDMLFRGDVSGVEHIPASGPVVIAANHASFLDPPFIGAQIPRQLNFFARKSLWKPGVARWWLDAVGTIPVDRDGTSDVGAIKRVIRALADGGALVLFPEGTRTPDGALQDAKPGVGMIACRTRVPVVPARIFGSFEAMGRQGGLRLGHPVSVVFGPALQPADYDPGPSAGPERYQIASSRIMAAISKLSPPPSSTV